MKALLDIVLLLIGLVYELNLSGMLSYRGVGIDLLCVLLCSLSILQGPIYGAVCGLAVGVILDGIFGHFGLYAAGYLAVGLLAGLFAEKMRFDKIVMPLICFAVLYLFKELPAVLYLFFQAVPISWPSVFLKLLLGALVGCALFMPLHLLFVRLHKWEVVQAPLFHNRKW